MATNRPRGFAPWTPQAKTRPLLDATREVLTEYQNYLPLTARQIFYRLVGTGQISKTDGAYKNLLEMLNRARRSHLIAMSDIRDDGLTISRLNSFDSKTEWIKLLPEWAKRFDLNLQLDQPYHLMVMCEAAGMVPQLARVCSPFAIEVRSSGGFDSTTVKHDLGRMVGSIGKPVVLFHIGDHDPSGEHIHQNLADDVGAFARSYGGRMTLVRIAVTPEQQAVHNLPTAPPNPKDKRKFESGFTVQAEALPPDVLAQILKHEVERYTDLDIYAKAVSRQGEIRDELQELVRKLQPEAG